jgi:hypothetical protein
MISFVSNYRFSASQSDYTHRPSIATTEDSDLNAQQDPRLKPEAFKSTDNKKTGELSEEDLKLISALKQRDSEVRAHEAAHLAAAGNIATSGASFSYQKGPDGTRYAIGGEVNIDTSPVSGDPAATLRKAENIRRAALAPAHPSGPDLQVAASATAAASQALAELLQKNLESQSGSLGQRGHKIDLSA